MTPPAEQAAREAAEWFHANKWTYGTNIISMLIAYAETRERAARMEERAACVKFIEEWGDDDMFPRDTAAAIQEAANALRRAPAGDAGQEGEG